VHRISQFSHLSREQSTPIEGEGPLRHIHEAKESTEGISMKLWKKIVVALAAVFVILQFVRPEKNIGTSSAHTIAQRFTVPSGVETILRRSCYDCHSNNTVYPWYAEIQPAGWFLAKHIRAGKRGLNFDEYSTYRLMKQYRRLQDISDQIENDEMPLPSYLIIHKDARLGASEKNELVKWCAAMQDSMKANLPADSLERRPQQ
jgi:hypothetical protein